MAGVGPKRWACALYSTEKKLVLGVAFDTRLAHLAFFLYVYLKTNDISPIYLLF